MKKLILLLMLGSLFGQTLYTDSHDKMLLIDGTEVEGEYISMNNENIIFKPTGYPAGQPVSITKVKLVKLSDGTIVYRYKINIPPSFLQLYQNKIGGGLITLGSGMLIYNTNRECNDCGLDFDEFADSLKRTATIGYFLIAVGGIVLAL